MILKVGKSQRTVVCYSLTVQLLQLNTWKVIVNRTGQKMFLSCETSQMQEFDQRVFSVYLV